MLRTCALLLGVSAGLASPLGADPVPIDDFTVPGFGSFGIPGGGGPVGPTTVTPSGADRTFNADVLIENVNASTNVGVGSGFLTFATPNGEVSNLLLSYDNLPANLMNLTGGAFEVPYSVNALAPETNAFVVLLDTNGDSLMSEVEVTPTSGTEILEFSMFAGAGDISSIEELQFHFQPIGGGVDFDINGDGFRFVPEQQVVPEPSTLTILGLSGVAGLVIARRRRKNTQISV